MAYSAEQADDGSGMDADLLPWLRSEWNVDVEVSEFPYFHYLTAEESEDVARWMDSYGCDDIWTLPPKLRESSAYRTDIAAARVDSRAVDRRATRVGHLETLTDGEGWGKEQPHLRAYLNIRRDGAMTREYYVRDHGLHGEPNGQPPEVADRELDWLIRNRFVETSPDDPPEYRPVDIRPVFAAVHAVELKRDPREWQTAMEQAARAEVYADYRWVCYSERTADRALANAGAFRAEGVGLLTVSSSTGGGTVHVEPERVTPPEDHDLLSRPYCERWELNERVLKRHRERATR